MEGLERMDPNEHEASAPMPELHTDRLYLREFQERDIERAHEFFSDPEVMRYLSWEPFSEKETRDFVQQLIANREATPRMYYDFAIVRKEDDRLIGWCNIRLHGASDARQGEIGFVMNPKFQGRGYTAEASAALLEFGFKNLELNRIFGTCDPRNTPSARVMERAGMKREELRESVKQRKGEWRDEVVYGMSKDMWLEAGAQRATEGGAYDTDSPQIPL